MSYLPDDQAAWLPIAADVLADKYRKCDSSTRESITIGLRNIDHPDCQAAVKKLNPDTFK